MRVLKGKLFELEQQKKEAEFQNIVGEKKDIAWGSQIRSYVFQPYQMVKDHRTNHESGNVCCSDGWGLGPLYRSISCENLYQVKRKVSPREMVMTSFVKEKWERFS